MIVLALDTTAAAGSLAVCDGPRVLAELTGDPARPHGERLPGDILRVLAQAGQPLEAVALFVVASGPGAFTGLRIGIATVQGFAFALGRPAVGVSALEAHATLLAALPACPPGDLLGVWMDAARGEVFQAIYERVPEDQTLRPVVPDRVGAPQDLVAIARPPDGRGACWTGSGAVRYRGVLAGDPSKRIVERLPPLARGVAWLGLAAHAAGRSGPPHAIQPLYVRRPDAELARERRDLSGRPA